MQDTAYPTFQGSYSICDVSPDFGNGETDAGEECDDDNNDSGDGCSAYCEIEEGWMCVPRNLKKNSACFMVSCGGPAGDKNKHRLAK